MDGPLMDHMHNNFFSNNKRKYPTYEYTLEKEKKLQGCYNYKQKEDEN